MLCIVYGKPGKLNSYILQTGMFLVINDKRKKDKWIMMQAGQSVDRRNVAEKSWSLTWMKERSRGADRNLRWSRVVEKCRRVGTNYSWRMHPSRAERQCGFESPDRGRHSQLCVCTHLHLETLSNATAPSPLKHKTPWDGRSQQTPPSTSSSLPNPSTLWTTSSSFLLHQCRKCRCLREMV